MAACRNRCSERRNGFNLWRDRDRQELVARAIHQLSRRRDKPLVRVNCTSIPKDLFESEFEILSKVVYAERAHPVEMISKVSLGGLLDLFLTVDEFDARYDFGEQFRTVEPAPVFLGFQAQFKDHGQCRDS